MTPDAALLEAYARGPAELAAALASVPEGRRSVRPVPGRWSAREIALHLWHTELAMAFRMARAVAEPGTPVPAFDQDRWVERLGPAEDVDLALAAFAALRAALAAALRRLPPEAWSGTAVHPEAGAVTLAEWLERTVRHTAHHVAQIRALAAAP